MSAVLISTVAVIWSLRVHDRGRPLRAAALVLFGATFYEQALCAPLAMLALNGARGRRFFWGLVPPAVAVGGFLAVDLWTLRDTARVSASKPGADSLRQILFAPLKALDLQVPFTTTWLEVIVLSAVIAAAIAWRHMRGLRIGLALSWISALPFIGWNQGWPDWYVYLPAVGVTIALGLAAPRS